MMAAKDYFSGHSKIYAAFRPGYPEPLYQFILHHVPSRSIAWDCATGNGQVAAVLSKHFTKVMATDISRQQLDEAVQVPNIHYSPVPAEKTGFEAHQFDLITVAQALHWFNTDLFYDEVRRTAKPGGILAVWGYALLTVDPVIDALFLNLYYNTLGEYWDTARKLVENRYRDIPFPFDALQVPEFSITLHWSLDQFAGYLNSWSATQKFIQLEGYNPVERMLPELAAHWNKNEEKTVHFPVFMKLGKI